MIWPQVTGENPLVMYNKFLRRFPEETPLLPYAKVEDESWLFTWFSEAVLGTKEGKKSYYP